VARGDRSLIVNACGTSGPEAAGRIGDWSTTRTRSSAGTRLNAPSPTAGPCDTCWFAGASTLALAVNCCRAP